ncbi:MAG TPA: glycogen debranching N-terminal domain-containing protein [Actinomycetota bacterium]|nr:glycogen debranching N-terminal domain-containing protein [Actinomycetota bacterium]
MEPPSQLAGAPWGGATPGVEPDAFDESQPVPASTVTLVEGATFTICGPDGDLDGSGVAGLFVGDTRICSRLVLSIDGDGVEPLTLAARSPSSATFVGRTFDKRLLVFRDLWVGQGMRIDLRIRNLAREVRPVTVRLSVEADLAELFTVKKGEAPAVETPCTAEGGELRFDGDGRRRGLIVHTTGEARTDDGCAIVWQAELQPRQTWTACVELRALRGGEEVSPTYPCGQAPELTPTTTSRLAWRRRLPHLATDVPGLSRAFSRTGEDLGALQLTDPDHPEDLLVAAGAPWYMTLFGRDSILTSWMALLLDPTLGLGTARSLARMQGLRDVAESDEQPGRILHEIRFSRGPSLALADGDIDYGSADVTPLFVMLVHELWRWGAPVEQIQALRPAVEAALAWLEGPGDPDGDGYIEYAPGGPGSLGNQGWKDSHDAVAFADGRLAEAPIAAAEVQAYAYAAWRGAAALAAADGDEAAAAARHARADHLQARFEQDFWLPDREAFAIALDREKSPVDAIASNMGHCLWAGIVADPDKAAAVARWLVSPELFTGWGIRTLATSMTRYSPLSYHNGSVWPHDTAICVAGLRRYGFIEEAHLVAGGLLPAADALEGRLPELFAGLTIGEMPVPVRYPTSCSPQAWASAAPLLVVRALLGFEPDVPQGRIDLDPSLPVGSTTLRLTNMPLAGARVEIDVDGAGVEVAGLPSGIASFIH